MRQICYQDIGSMEQLNSKPPNYPAISISIRSEADQVKSLRNPPNLPLTYTFGRVDIGNTKPFLVSGPGDDLKILKYKDFSFYMMQNKSINQVKQFVKIKTFEMELDQKRVQKIIDIDLKEYQSSGDDPGSQLMQEVLDKYFSRQNQSSNVLIKKKKHQSRISLSNNNNNNNNNNDQQLIRIKVPSQYLRNQEAQQQQDTVAFMKIPLGLSSHINESHKFQRKIGLHINENQLIMCNICCEEWFYSQFFRISKQCTHIFCITCAQSYLIHKIQSSDVFCIKCPQDDCSIYFYDHEIFLALNQDHHYIRKYMTIKKLKILNSNPRNRWCINPKCNNYLKTEQDSALTLAFPQLAEMQEINFAECDYCKTKFCQYCCYSAHPGLTCEQNYEVIYTQLKKKKKNQSCEQKMQPCTDILSFFIKLIIYIILYIFYIIICIPLSLFYPFYMFTQIRKYKELNQNIIIKVFSFFFLLILSILMYPLTLLMLITVGIKIHYLPKVKRLLELPFSKKK